MRFSRPLSTGVIGELASCPRNPALMGGSRASLRSLRSASAAPTQLLAAVNFAEIAGPKGRSSQQNSR